MRSYSRQSLGGISLFCFYFPSLILKVRKSVLKGARPPMPPPSYNIKEKIVHSSQFKRRSSSNSTRTALCDYLLQDTIATKSSSLSPPSTPRKVTSFYGFPQQLAALIQACWASDPAERPNMHVFYAW
mmetsp:Transcript_7448/g.11806  ORF Transcript_7448/g.11806 Transcript_7448/m.11806 type:complete len:128 (-) Transcript_7448:543-926(-)